MPVMRDSHTRFVFTQRLLEAAGPHDADSPSAQLELCDALCIGLRMMVGKGTPPRKTWRFRYRWRGQKCCMNLGEFGSLSVKQARERVFELKAALARGEDPAQEKRDRAAMPTFGDFADEQYVPYMKATVRRPDVVMSRLRTGCQPYFKDRPLDTITAKHVVEFHSAMRDKTSATTANHHFVLLRRMMNLAVQWGLLEKNPCSGVKKFTEPNARERFLSQEEIGRFIEEVDKLSNKSVAAGLKLLLFTGLRMREGLHLPWSCVNREEGTLYLAQTKNGKGRTVVLNALAKEVIEAQWAARKGDHPYVFPGKVPGQPVNNPHKPFAQACKLANIHDFRVHDLRHTYATLCINSGASLHTVGALLGHQSMEMTRRYAHLEKETLRRATEQVAQQISARPGS